MFNPLAIQTALVIQAERVARAEAASRYRDRRPTTRIVIGRKARPGERLIIAIAKGP